MHGLRFVGYLYGGGESDTCQGRIYLTTYETMWNHDLIPTWELVCTPRPKCSCSFWKNRLVDLPGRKSVRGPIGNRFAVDLSETVLWIYRKLFRGPIGNQYVDLLETVSWTYRKLFREPIGNRYVDLLETDSWTYRKPYRGQIWNRFVDHPDATPFGCV